MQLKTLILTAIATLTITACTSAPKIPQIDAGVLQELQNIKDTGYNEENKAQLVKLNEKCSIEFTTRLQEGYLIEKWIFSGFKLYSAGAVTFLPNGLSEAQKYDLHDAKVQNQFLTMRDYFAKNAIEQCK